MGNNAALDCSSHVVFRIVKGLELPGRVPLLAYGRKPGYVVQIPGVRFP